MSVFSHAEFNAHEQVVFVEDKASGLRAIIAVHDTRLGAAVGGCRMYPYHSDTDALTDALRALAASGRIEVRVTPGASRDEIRVDGGAVQLRVTAPPADGAANDAVLRLLAAALGRPRRDLSLLRGASARVKLVGIATN